MNLTESARRELRRAGRDWMDQSKVAKARPRKTNTSTKYNPCRVCKVLLWPGYAFIWILNRWF